ncbi:pyridoxal-dependent decarboxylase [Micromonospora sp. BRA006-A]|nr:pyridoxal-dependent decarboxylase [Micromonospora sp. BRA006-A]
MDELRHLFRRAADHTADYRLSLPDRPVGVPVDQAALNEAFAGPLPDAPTPPEQVLAELVAAAEPGLVATAGPRYFASSSAAPRPPPPPRTCWPPGGTRTRSTLSPRPPRWPPSRPPEPGLGELLGIPATASVGFVTGGQAANTAGLAAARHQVLADAGWDVERRGLSGAPAVRVFAGAERHATVDRSLRLLGLGTDALRPVPTGTQGAIDPDALEAALRDAGPGPTIVCLQAGNVNTGACDELRRACDLAHRYGGWAHVDGAFGLWAAASPSTRHLVDGLEAADPWACDGHKWLNLPYDTAFAFCARPDAHAAAMSLAAAYLVGSGGVPAGAELTAESSRRARGFAVWAACGSWAATASPRWSSGVARWPGGSPTG